MIQRGDFQHDVIQEAIRDHFFYHHLPVGNICHHHGGGGEALRTSQASQQTATLEINANGGISAITSVPQYGTEPIIMPDESYATRDGYMLVGWNTKSDGTGIHYYPKQELSLNVNQHLAVYAEWKSISDYPEYLVNGNFEHFDHALFSKTANTPGAIANWVVCDKWNHGTAQVNGGSDDPNFKSSLPAWMNESSFGWNSLANTIPSWASVWVWNGINLSKGTRSNNIYCEINAYTVYQDIRTTPGVLYKWKLKHASRDKTKRNSMMVEIGAPGDTSPVEAYRTKVNGFGDKEEGVSYYISTQNGNSSSDTSSYESQWETYEGSYVADSQITRFSFSGKDANDNIVSGSRIDDIVFSRAFPIYYDMNDDDNSKADRNGIYANAAIAENGLQGYANEYEKANLTAIVPKRNGYTFLGWSLEKINDIAIGEDPSSVSGKLVTDLTPTGTTTVYAVWQEHSAPLIYHIEGYDNLSRGGIYDDPSENNNVGYHSIGSTVSLTSTKPTRAAHTFLGWSTKQMKDIAYLDDDKKDAFLASSEHVSSVTIPSGGITVYAVWQEAYSRKIINGDFEYHPFLDSSEGWQVFMVGISDREHPYYTFWSPSIPWTLGTADFSPKLYGWDSSQDTGIADRCTLDDVYSEIQHDGYEDNTYGELVADQEKKSIYQDILTEPGSLYKWSLKHQSRKNDSIDIMKVKIGSIEKQSEQEAKRVESNGLCGDIVDFQEGKKSTNISNIVKGKRADYDTHGYWDSYEGFYLVPSDTNQWVTRFTFESEQGIDEITGNFLDDIKFEISYALIYDLNNGTSDSIITDFEKAKKDYAGYHAKGESIVFPASSELDAPSGMFFLGWSATKQESITTDTSPEKAEAILDSILSSYPMPGHNAILHAVYAEAPSITSEHNEGGTVSDADITTAPEDALPTVTVNVYPDQGHRIDKILVDGKELSLPILAEDDEYTVTLEEVVGNHHVEVVFKDMRKVMPHSGSMSNALIIASGIGLMLIGMSVVLSSKRKKEALE